MSQQTERQRGVGRGGGRRGRERGEGWGKREERERSRGVRGGLMHLRKCEDIADCDCRLKHAELEDKIGLAVYVI